MSATPFRLPDRPSRLGHVWQRAVRALRRRAGSLLCAAALLPAAGSSVAVDVNVNVAVAVAAAQDRPAAAVEPLRVDDRATVPAWPAVTLLGDASHRLTLSDVLARPGDFAVPVGTAGNLGRVAAAVWLKIPVRVAGDAPVQRVLEIDYPALYRVDVYVVRDGQLQASHRLGSQLRLDERPLPSRSHAVALTLAPGASELLLRVDTPTSLVLPITLRTMPDFTANEARSQLLQGVLAGVALCMLAYSLSNWFSLRDAVFLHYAVLLLANAVYLLCYFGIGAVYVWPGLPQLSQKLAPLAILTAVAAATGFIHNAMRVREISRRAALLLRGCGAAAVLAVAGGLLGVLSYPVTQTLAIVLGFACVLSVLPVCFARARHGDKVAAYMLFGWGCYLVGGLSVAGLLRGFLEPTFWSQHIYPLASMLEMAAWMGVLGLRVNAIHRDADRIRLDGEMQRRLANTDALTGLPNRRGLQERLAQALQQCHPQQLLAVFLLDLDGFKPVNDRHGHDTGDALLVAVGRRLQAQLRDSDMVARLGGDEFVVLAQALPDEATAQRLGQKMLAAFDHPFIANGQRCAVGLTIGYALAPLDGRGGDDLLKRADAAMYAGKQAGRSCLQRGGRSLATV